MNGPFPPEIERRIRRLRRFAAALWLVWTLPAYALYWVYANVPRTPMISQMLWGGIAILAMTVVWFIYMIYRIGELGSTYEQDDATLQQTEGIHLPDKLE